MTERETVVAAFKQAHDEYLHIVHENLSPDERKELVSDSMRRYQKLLDGAETMDLEVFQAALSAIKKSKEELSFTRGFCSKGCMTQLLMTQDTAITAAMTVDKLKEAPEIWTAFLSATNDVVAHALLSVCAISADRDKHNWQVRTEAHDIVEKATKTLVKMREAIEVGDFMVIRLPDAEKGKYKEFMN